MDRIRRLFKKWVPAEEYGRTVNPGAAHHAAQQFLKSHDQLTNTSTQNACNLFIYARVVIASEFPIVSFCLSRH